MNLHEWNEDPVDDGKQKFDTWADEYAHTKKYKEHKDAVQQLQEQFNVDFMDLRCLFPGEIKRTHPQYWSFKMKSNRSAWEQLKCDIIFFEYKEFEKRWERTVKPGSNKSEHEKYLEKVGWSASDSGMTREQLAQKLNVNQIAQELNQKYAIEPPKQKVYTLLHTNEEKTDVFSGVFDSRETAEAHVPSNKKCEYSVICSEVNELVNFELFTTTDLFYWERKT